MGSGKSSVSRRLGKRLGVRVVETDALIIERSGKQSIKQIFVEDGEARFRELEQEVIASLAGTEDIVISPGGGVIEAEKNILALKAQGGKIVFLETSFQVIQRRVPDVNNRPLFSDRENAKVLFENRRERYRQAADFVIDTDRLTQAQVAERIVAWLHSLHG